MPGTPRTALVAAVAIIAGVLAMGGLPAAAAVAVDPRTSFGSSTVSPSAASDVSKTALTGFDPGNIIDDAMFFASGTMSAAEIQSFLNSKVPACKSGYTCLKDFGQATQSRPADAMCPTAYSGRSWESAASIIYNVAQACGINPQVILVTLQKEQGLVTHVWPSDWRYTIAMGQGCPDTAACDTRYYGFFNQVYGAAWQLKRYANPPGTSQYFTWYAPGRTWNVLYNPNRDCGSAPVRVQNQATANLYYYTPYQPNAAALRAGYGEGDGCSSYGNRNFYNYFTDWFGTTRGGPITLARTAADPAVYLISGTSRWHIADPDDFADLNGSLGPTRVVAPAYLASFASRGVTSAVLRNASNGMMAVVQGGRFHPVTTCEQAARWGSSCANPTTVEAEIFGRLAQAGEAGNFFRVRGSTFWGRFDTATTATMLYDERAARAANNNMAVSPSGPYIASARLARISQSSPVFAPGQLIRPDGSTRVFLTIDFDRLAWVRDWSEVADYGLSAADLVVVAGKQLGRYREDGVVTPTLRCPSGTYLLAEGTIRRLAEPANVGIATANAAEVSCAQYPMGRAVPGLLSVKSPASSTVYIIREGERRRALTWSSLVAATGEASPIVVTLVGGATRALPEGAPVADGLVVKAAASDLWFVSGTTAHHVPRFELLSESGISTTFSVISDGERAKLMTGDPLTSWLRCGSDSYFAAGGGVHLVKSGANGFTGTALDDATCAGLRKLGAVDRVFVRGVSSPQVYAADAGRYVEVRSWAELVRLAGPAPVVLTVSDSMMRSLVR